jgi:2-oxoacid:acceptor oxidoreductase delta subunit (pyruvate/2-ketoisovalerate family)
LSSSNITVYITKPGSSAERDMSGWRNRKPLVHYDKCTNCLICWIYCPEPAIIRDPSGKIVIDYMHCKGCGICAAECPRKCIEMVSE